MQEQQSLYYRHGACVHVLLNSFVTLPLAKVGALRFQHVKKEGSSAFFTHWNQRNPTFPHDCTSGGALISLALPFIFVYNHYHHFIIACCVSLCNLDAIPVRSLVYVCACIRTYVHLLLPACMQLQHLLRGYIPIALPPIVALTHCLPYVY